MTALACGAVTWLLLLSHYLDNAHHATVTQRRQDLLLRRAAVDARRTNAADMLSKTHIWPCGVAPWSLRHQLDECEVGATALRIYYGYRALPYANSWNGFPLVEKLLLAAGFVSRGKPREACTASKCIPWSGSNLGTSVSSGGPLYLL